MVEVQDLVVDASVGVKVFLREDGTEEARSLFRSMTGPQAKSLLVPDSFFPECGAALRKAVLRNGLPAAIAEGEMVRLCALGLAVRGSRDLAACALRLANAEGLSVYDAVYVALSDRTGAPLVTADRRLHGRLQAKGHRVLGLWEMPAA